MAVQTITTLKANMPVGTTGGTSVEDIHDIVDTFEDKSQKTKASIASMEMGITDFYERMLILESLLTSTPSPVSTYDWTSGVPLIGVTASRTGTATVVNKTGARVSAPVNTQRIDYSGTNDASCLGLLIEPETTNIMWASQDLNLGWGTGDISVTTGGGGTGMDGSNSLSTVLATGTQPRAARGSPFPEGSTLQLTWWLKAGTFRYVVLSLFDPEYSDGDFVWVDIVDGSVTGISSGGSQIFNTTAKCRKFANGIVEIAISAQTAGITSGQFEVRGVSGSGSFDGAAGNTFFFDSVQLVAGPLQTSYVPAPVFENVTRGADVVTATIPTGSYDVLVEDAFGHEWRNGVAISGNAYTLTPRAGFRHVQKLRAYAAGVLTEAQKSLIVARPMYSYKKGYKMVWADEFTDPDITRFSESGLTEGAYGGKAWRSRFPFGELVHARSVNNESQLYTNSEFMGIVPFSVNNSVLSIKSDVFPSGTTIPFTNENYEPDAPYKFYSGVITSEKSAVFTYGVFEIRSKSPVAHGTWPAFWLFREEVQDGTEIKGELDIFEHVGAARVTESYQAYHDHVGNPSLITGGHFASLPHGNIGDWHVYALKWEPGRVRWYIDGIMTKEIVTDRFDNQKCYIIINLALNTSLWTGVNGAAGAGDPLPAEMPLYLHVDYVRVYQSTS